jgi:hypothetical protein
MLTMSWYLRKNDDVVYGPVDDSTLRQWAAEDRIAPEDQVSQDRQIWSPAHDQPGLEMDWLIEMDDGTRYGPINLAALREFATNGLLAPQTRLTHKTTGAVRLLDKSMASPEEPVAQPAPVETPKLSAPDTPVPARAEWKEIAQSKDFFEREAHKWRKMYEDEHTGFLRRENTLNERINEMQKSELSSRQLIDQMRRQIARIESAYNQMKQTVESGSTDDKTTQLVALMESYRELSQQYDAVTQQLTAKSQEIQTLIQSRAETEKMAEEQIQRMEQIARREREEADHARQQSADMEENHLHLAKAYRELNERFVRLREQNPTLRSAPVSSATSSV